MYKIGGRLGKPKDTIDLSGKYVQAEPSTVPLSKMFKVSQGVRWAARVCMCACVQHHHTIPHHTHIHIHTHTTPRTHTTQLHIFNSDGGLDETLTLSANSAADMREWCSELNRTFGEDASAAADAASGVGGVGSLIAQDSFSRSPRHPRALPGGRPSMMGPADPGSGSMSPMPSSPMPRASGRPSMMGPAGPGSMSSSPSSKSSSRSSLAETGRNLLNRATNPGFNLSLGLSAGSGSRRSSGEEAQRPSLVRSPLHVSARAPAPAPAPPPFRVGDRVECR